MKYFLVFIFLLFLILWDRKLNVWVCCTKNKSSCATWRKLWQAFSLLLYILQTKKYSYSFCGWWTKNFCFVFDRCDSHTHTHTNTKKQECGWFTDSGFGLTILVVLGVLKSRGANGFCLESAWLWTEARNPQWSKSWRKSVHEMKPALVLVNELVYCTQNKAAKMRCYL